MPVSIDVLLRLPPRIFGTIRWKKSIGKPPGDLCSAFEIKVEEHTATEFRDAGGGVYLPEPGTGIFKSVPESVSCWTRAEEENYYSIGFQVSGLHFNMPFDGYYKITPVLKGSWPSSIFAIGYRVVDPPSIRFYLKEDDRVQSGEFEVRLRSWFLGRLK